MLRPFAERVGRARVPRLARALGCFRAELRLRVADPRLDERAVERLFDARLVERDLFDAPEAERDLEELDDVPRRGDVLVWAMFFSYLLGIRSRPPYPEENRSNPPRPLPHRRSRLARTERDLELLTAFLRHLGRVEAEAAALNGGASSG